MQITCAAEWYDAIRRCNKLTMKDKRSKKDLREIRLINQSLLTYVEAGGKT
jgi:hypothetical protein